MMIYAPNLDSSGSKLPVKATSFQLPNLNAGKQNEIKQKPPSYLNSPFGDLTLIPHGWSSYLMTLKCPFQKEICLQIHMSWFFIRVEIKEACYKYQELNKGYRKHCDKECLITIPGPKLSLYTGD